MKLLIVEDDPDILEFVKIGFEADGYSVDTASDGHQGSLLARTNAYGAIVLDYSLPQKSGFDVCSEVRASGFSTPILFLSVMGDTQRKIEALTRGADDYMTKPFHFEELRARIKALLRRPVKMENSRFKVGTMSIDTDKRIIYKNEEPLTLTRKEYSLLEYFLKNPGIALSRSMLMEHVWSVDSDPFSNTVEAHVLKLRKKLNIPGEKEMIKNILGRGYILDP